jgi:hypothetical protein
LRAFSKLAAFSNPWAVIVNKKFMLISPDGQLPNVDASRHSPAKTQVPFREE